MYVRLTIMVKMPWVLFVFLTTLNTIRGMKKINIHDGSSAVLSWTIHNRTEDMLYINHNNRTIIRIWPEKGYFKPTLEYNTRLEFSFVKQNLDVTLNLLLKNISELDEGLYTCYMQLHDKEISTVQLLVSGPFEEPRGTDGPDNITFIPGETTIHEYNSLEMMCFTNCYISCSFQWIKHDGQDIHENLVSDMNILHIPNVTRMDSGNYSCRAKNTVTNKTVVDVITLDVMYGPDNITIIPPETAIYEFDILNITCVAHCHISCSFQWIKHGDKDSLDSRVADLAIMQIPHATRKDAGNYSCRATNTVTNKTVVDSIMLEVNYHNNLRNNSLNDTTIPAEGSPPSDTIWMLILKNILPGIAVSIICLICGFLVHKSRKRCCKKSSINSSVIEVDQPHDVIGNSVTLELVYNDIDLHNNYWTIGENSTGGLHSVLDKACTSGNPSFGSRSCSIKQDDSSENLQEVYLQSDEDAYINPI